MFKSMYYDIGGYDMKYDEFREMCHKAWSERYNYLCIDMTKNKNDGKYRISNERKTTYIDCIPETEPFKKNIQVYSNVFCKQIHSHSFK